MAPKTRRIGLVNLITKARAEYAEDGWLLTGVTHVIYAEAREFLVNGVTPTAPAPTWAADPVTIKLRTMRLAGLDRCGECRRAVPSLDVLADWEDRDRAAWIELVRREGAA